LERHPKGEKRGRKNGKKEMSGLDINGVSGLKKGAEKKISSSRGKLKEGKH